MILHHEVHLSHGHRITHMTAFCILIVQSSFKKIQVVSHTIMHPLFFRFTVHLLSAHMPDLGFLTLSMPAHLCCVTEWT